MKNRIQFYHYYVLRILCPISLYTFLNKQISNKREKIKLTYYVFKLSNHEKGTCEGTDTIFMQWNQKTRREIGYHLKNHFCVCVFLFFVLFLFLTI